MSTSDLDSAALDAATEVVEEALAGDYASARDIAAFAVETYLAHLRREEDPDVPTP